MSDQPNPFAPHWLIRDIVIGSHMAAAGAGGLLFVGDSIVEGFWWNRIGGVPVVNAGYSGIWTEALQPKVQRLISNARPGIVALLVGTNDAKKGQTAQGVSEVMDYYGQIVDILKDAGVPVVLITPPPVEAQKRLTGFYNPEAMAELSRRIVEIGVARKTSVIDMHSAFRGDEHFAENGTSVDGVHLSAQAYLRLRDMLERVIARHTGRTTQEPS